MDPKQRRLMMIKVGAGLGLAILFAFLMWELFGPSPKQAPRQQQLGSSDSMVPTVAPTPVKKVPGTLQATPASIQFDRSKPTNQLVTLRADQGPVQIGDVAIPTADADAVNVANLDCDVSRPLQPGTTCLASVTWTGSRAVNTTLTISYSTTSAAGQPVQATTSIAVSAQGALPTATPTPAATPAAGANGQTPAAGQVGQLPQQQGARVERRIDPQTQLRNEYLVKRFGQPSSVIQGQLQPAASAYTSWDNIGVPGTKSSYPVDMSRVITPDKPLTAVLTYQVDTRQTVTAVAMVDRDVYGGNGRTVVIPRGTKVIGRVGGGATDRVGIAWNQIIRPDGVRFVFTGESGDAMGRGGVPGRVNNRYLERYGYSLIPSAISAGITAALGGQSSSTAGTLGATQTQDARAVAAQILQQPLTQIGQDIYQKHANVPVQITIPAGTRMTIWSTGDLRLKPLGEQDGPTAAAQNQNQTSFGAGGSRFSYPTGGQGQGQQQQQGQQATQPVQNGVQQDNGQGNAALQVGRVDANGNYIPPGSNAPAPGPIAANTDNATRAAQQQQNGQQGAQAQNGARTGFPASSNPWQ